MCVRKGHAGHLASLTGLHQLLTPQRIITLSLQLSLQLLVTDECSELFFTNLTQHKVTSNLLLELSFIHNLVQGYLHYVILKEFSSDWPVLSQDVCGIQKMWGR